ncbi:helix-turn-helix transcriptional regulator [Corynebacterium sanguinis]|uniref:WYL domain-containing protein n=1 Tax=Corynebacterium sanguinis TaxID=2594913 RepID=A0A6C1TWL4_9CORY|nr:WYL domain-containing protein [Corynebacterium sanguinis]TVS28516.1 WYL domain-containing protein [Corynebacterium sanguinis]
MANDDPAIDRLTNLTFALLGTQRPRDYEWVRGRVEGYKDYADSEKGRASFHRQLNRDIQTIRRAGVPARMENGLVWVDKDAYTLPPIEFTDEEATVLGLAGDLGRERSLGAFARSGWTKLAASGATRSFDSPALASVDNDVIRLDAETVKGVTACVRAKKRMVFDYAPAPAADVQRRVMDPWGIVALNNRAYVVGWDAEREAERAFRAMRVSNVRVTSAERFHAASRPLADVVNDIMRGPVTDARIGVATSASFELETKGTRVGDVVEFVGVERDWLVRTVASVAPDVFEIEPDDVRRDVIALLSATVEASDEG